MGKAADFVAFRIDGLAHAGAQDDPVAALLACSPALLTRVLALAQRSRDEGHHPFAAMVVGADGSVIAEAMNASSVDRTAHAESNALRLASSRYSPGELASATLYASAEPYAMCAGGIYWSGVGRLGYAMSEASLFALTGSDAENPTLSLPCREVFERGQRPTTVSARYARTRHAPRTPASGISRFGQADSATCKSAKKMPAVWRA